ncbi:hypothetical protein [Streptomyces yaizuensis]|uniref:Uncharacterized protein n=1 Tax=Streptomyces yaizuensis TaxID=2989713 RepID=A0ABQ5NYN4_9ACTN|nr:hypothetical protein [Streptomyces sp. YSPA8]GLF95300.1 hypothetical protein SYYSPA8_13405 [Streptomyces sp. YSPA8]
MTGKAKPGKPGLIEVKTSEEVTEDFRTASTGVGTGYTPFEVPPGREHCQVGGIVSDQMAAGQGQVEQVVAGLRELGWVPAGQSGVRVKDGVTLADLQAGPWKVQLSGADYPGDVREEISANAGLAFEAVGDCDAKPKRSPGGTGGEKRGGTSREQVVRDLRAALKALGTEPTFKKQEADCEVSAVLPLTVRPGRAELRRIAGLLEDHGWKDESGMGITADDDGTMAMAMDHGDWSVVIGNDRTPQGLKHAIVADAFGPCDEGL